LVDTRVVVQGQVSTQRLSFYERIKAHGYLLSQHKGDYLRQIPRRLRNKIKRQQRRWKKYYAHFMCRFYLKCKLPLPAHLQEFLFEEAARTEFNYKPKPYPGRLTLFRAQDQKLFEDPEPGWRDVPAGGLELHDIPGNHASIWHEPNVHSLTEKLKNCIQKALEEKQ
ncbi:MAG: hypothetical protein SVR94_16845, partial [Pseudomonadota bacterium]|nr:hypothetical protein [Pseudomonadota bacterium]